MRGLKQRGFATQKFALWSHLLQMRGLKLFLYFVMRRVLSVASFTDAWIETTSNGVQADSGVSHLLQMRGLKPGCHDGHILRKTSHLLQMRGLKLIHKGKDK